MKLIKLKHIALIVYISWKLEKALANRLDGFHRGQSVESRPRPPRSKILKGRGHLISSVSV